MGKGEKMVKDLDSSVIAVDTLDNMNDLEVDTELPCCHRDYLTLQSDKANEGGVENWINIDMISKLQACENCMALNGVSCDQIKKKENLTSYDKIVIPRNGYRISDGIKGLLRCKSETSNKQTDLVAIGRIDDGSWRPTDDCLNCNAVEFKQITQEKTDTDSTEGDVQTDVDGDTETVINTDVNKNEVADTEKDAAGSRNTSACARDKIDYLNDVSKLDINNPNLFSDFEDSDDDVFETEFKTNISLPPYVNLLKTKSSKPSQTHSESAIFTDVSERTSNPAQTVSDSAIVTALGKKTHKADDSTVRRKSVHFAIFPYVIEIPRVSDLEEEFYHTERERYGKVP